MQQGLGQAYIASHDDRQVAVILVTDRIRDVGLLGVDELAGSGNLDLFSYGAELQARVDPVVLAAQHFNLRANGRLEPGVLDGDRVNAECQ